LLKFNNSNATVILRLQYQDATVKKLAVALKLIAVGNKCKVGQVMV